MDFSFGFGLSGRCTDNWSLLNCVPCLAHFIHPFSVLIIIIIMAVCVLIKMQLLTRKMLKFKAFFHFQQYFFGAA